MIMIGYKGREGVVVRYLEDFLDEYFSCLK